VSSSPPGGGKISAAPERFHFISGPVFFYISVAAAFSHLRRAHPAPGPTKNGLLIISGVAPGCWEVRRCRVARSCVASVLIVVVTIGVCLPGSAARRVNRVGRTLVIVAIGRVNHQSSSDF